VSGNESLAKSRDWCRFHGMKTISVERLQERVEVLEDLRDLQAAIAENGNELLIPWEQAKAELDLD